MAPPRKRRRLLDSLHSPSEMSLFEPTPTLTHAVSNIEYHPDIYGPRTVPKRIEEVHLHIQKRWVAFKVDEKAPLQKRQSAYAITTVDAAGNTIISTVTAGLNAGAATSTGPTAITSTSTHSKDTKTTSEKTTNSNNRNTASAGTVSVAAASTNSTSPGNSSGVSSKKVFVATLSNGNTKTITRSPSPYITTFGDGETSTICNQDGQCRLSADQSSAAAVGSAVTQSTAAAVNGDSSSSSTDDDGGGGTPISTIAGGIVGGLAGLAIILLLILFFLRSYKRRLRSGHQALARDSSPTQDPDHPFSSEPPGMSEHASLTPLAGAGFFRQQNRSAEDPGYGEHGFQKVSGRKLPSAFAGGVAHRDMNSPPPEMPLTGAAEKDLQGTSFYRDSTGFYGGDGAVSPDESQHSDQAPAAMTLSPGPQRRPTIHEPGPYVTVPSSSTPSTPAQHVRSPSGPGLSPFVDRSETPPNMRSDTPSTIADNRSSRFTEDF